MLDREVALLEDACMRRVISRVFIGTSTMALSGLDISMHQINGREISIIIK